MNKSTSKKINIFWFRRDLRLHDNTGLYHALKSGLPILPVFIFDKNILEKLETKDDARVMFIHDEIVRMNDSLKKAGAGMFVKYADPADVFRQLTEEHQVNEVFCNHDYEPYAKERDTVIENLLKKRGVGFKSFKDQVIFEGNEILNNQGEPYKVFTPYKKKWLSEFSDDKIESFDSEKLISKMNAPGSGPIPTLEDIGFKRSSIRIPGRKFDIDLIKSYKKNRNFPAKEGTSRLGIHLRHGTVNIREAVRKGLDYSDTWLNELIWREFYMMILDHFPHVVERSFNPKYDHIPWINDEENFSRWCEGKTGYPIVDAGMRQLNQTGYIHNRVRMITASFLTKHLLTDWRWGEAYFAGKLLDYELASNNGGWQWAAGTGTDAQPYFRVFNPDSQTEKFDPDQEYIKEWVPEISSYKYPEPIIDHTYARKRAIETFKKAME
jgi:deoxyribodipyrimidine photo-lyase